MGKKRTHRGKPGGKRRFLRGLTKELNATKDFDPSLWWNELPPILPINEESSNPSSSFKFVPPPADFRKEIIEFRKRAAKVTPEFIPSRIHTRPVAPTLYTRKPVRKHPHIIANIKVNVKILKIAQGFTISLEE